ncbi:MAG: sugar transferase [Johnsonella sp.]|nr:sugar transferase [Johnsonella sp.]
MNNSREKYKRLVKFGSAAVILCIEIFLYWLIWTRHYNLILEEPFWRRGNWLITALYGILLLFFLSTYGGLKIGYLRRWNLIYSQILSILLVNTISYLQLALIDKSFHNPMMFFLLTLGELLVIVAWVYLFQWIYSRLFPPRKLLVIYGEKPVFHIMQKINSRDDKYIIAGAIHVEKGISNIMEALKQYEGAIIGDISSHDRNQILKKCYEKSIRTYTAPKISDLLIRSSDELNLFDTPLLLSRNIGPQLDQLIVKRSMDLFFGTIMLILGSPVFLILALLIKLEDGGSVFYRQKRLTLDGKIFDILKFRTMREDAEKDGVARLSQKADHRITRVGRLLRATRFDELPQLINILRGEMSLVGPRPERPEIAAEYEKEIPEFCFRLKMKAGLTGYAQVYGKYNTTPYDKLKLDLTYIRNYTVWLDFKLLLMTPKILFIKESSEGIEEGLTAAIKNKKDLKEEVYGKMQIFE